MKITVDEFIEFVEFIRGAINNDMLDSINVEGTLIDVHQAASSDPMGEDPYYDYVTLSYEDGHGRIDEFVA